MLQSTVSCVNTSNIPQHSRESTWTKMEITSFVLKNLAGGREDNWCPWKDSNRTLDFSTAITRLELHSVERNHLPVLTEGRKEERRTKKGLI